MLLARLRLLPSTEAPDAPEPPDDEVREALIQEFLASPFAPNREETPAIVGHCMIARCDCGDGDPLRWSPTVVELFMLDYLPRKITLSRMQIDALPEVLTAWVRFTLTKRGLAERFIAETERVVQDLMPEFREAVRDPKELRPGQSRHDRHEGRRR